MFLFFKIRFNGEVGDVVVGRVTEVRRLLCDSTTSLFVRLVFGFNFFLFTLLKIGTTETLEGGDQLQTGLCASLIFCQSAWRRAGKWLEDVN